nr:RNA-dependent RNA polymerase [Actinidia chlorotic ringspot-associated virus]
MSESIERIKKAECDKVAQDVKDGKVFDNDVLSRFLSLVGKPRNRYTISSKPKEVEAIYKQCISSEGFMSELLSLAERILYSPPSSNQVDFALTIVQLLECSRHDELLFTVVNRLQDFGYNVTATDCQIKDVYPDVNSIMTPDIFYNDGNGKDYVLELKVRNKATDLSKYFNKYRSVLPAFVDISVMNYTTDGFLEFGEFKLSHQLNFIGDEFRLVDECINLAKSIREKYSQFPQYALFTQFNSESSRDDFMSGFTDLVINHPSYDEISKLFGSSWSDILDGLDNYSLIENEELVTDDLISSESDLHGYCNREILNYENHLSYYTFHNSYGRTKLNNKNLDLLIESKNLAKYRITKTYKPSIYIPITKTIKLDSYGGSRLKFYRDAFQNINIIGDRYSKSAYGLINEIFNTISVELLVSKDGCIDPLLYKDVLDPDFTKFLNDQTTKYRKVAHISNITSDTTILANNSFSINSHVDPFLKKNICDYDKKHYNPSEKKKECLSYKSSSADLPILLKLCSEIFHSDHHCGVYLNDLVTLEPMSMHVKGSDIPLESQTKYMEHLYNIHVIYKNLISLNTINSHKFRLLQTPDPNVIIILLPNADALRGNPLRYFCINIMNNDCETEVEANKLLGIYHSHTTTKKYTVMLSKVISLDVTRLKLLSNSFCKYSLLVSYYSQFKSKLPVNIHTMCWLMTQFITISSLTITDTYKNLIMAIYSDFSNIDKLIEDKLECRPRTIGQIYILKLMIDGLIKASDQLDQISLNKCKTEVDDSGELFGTGFDKSLKLRLPLSNLSTHTPKEIIHESFILFYIGNKGLHGSPQELLNLYYTPYEFEDEYKQMIENYQTFLIEDGNNSQMSFSYEAMKLTTRYAYAKLMSKSAEIRSNIISNLSLDSPILSIKQFSSTKSMVSNSIKTEIDRSINLPSNADLLILERYIDETKIDDIYEFVKEMNAQIDSINSRRVVEVEAQSIDNLSKLNKGKVMLPHLEIHVKNGVSFIGIARHKYAKAVDGNFIKQSNTKVFDEFYRICDEENINTLRQFYTKYIDDNELIIRIFYKDQRTADDREIYTGNAQTRLCLFPIEMTFKSICKHIPEEAITISGDQKQKRLLDQRVSLLKTKKYLDREKKQTEIYSVSSDASKWSARDLFPKYIITLAYNPYLTKNEKYFLLYLMLKYYKKKIVLTDSAFLNILRFASPDIVGNYERMTDGYTTNAFEVRSNWLQGNLNMTSSFVHHCSTLLTEMMLTVLSTHHHFNSVMTSMVHSDDSTYDFLIATDHNTTGDWSNKAQIGRLIVSLITFSNKKHCITLNEKKTYISTFYKEFLSTTIVNNELFFFYMADLLPIASDTSYTSPLGDFSSYNGYINNSFSHACPLRVIKTAICLINHLTLTTYNMQYTSEKNPKTMLPDPIDLPIQIYPRYKLNPSLAGSIPYYSSDAFNIVNDIIETLDKSDDLYKSLVEDIIDDQVVKSYLKVIKKDHPRKYKYIQYCMLTMDLNQYERDDQDPYNIIDYDLSQKSLINVVSLNKGSRIRKSHTYQQYLENEKLVKLTCAVNPMWCVSKPKDNDLIKLSILSNYSNPVFKDSLIFSKPALDYGRRIINSNKNLYTLSSHLFEKEKPRNLKTIYSQLAEKAQSIEVDEDMLIKYLSIYLFSDKKISASLQIYYSKKSVTYMDKPEFTKVIMPRSVYGEEYGTHSVNSMFENLLVEPYYNILTIDSKSERFIKTCEYSLQRIPSDIKLYRDPEDIDENFINYMTFKYHLAKPEDGLIKMCFEIDDDFNMIIYESKLTYQGLLIRYYTDIKKTIEDPSYNIPSYVSPNSLIMTIDSLMKRSEISTKIYMAHTRANRFDDYWLSRFGMYADDNFYIKYKLGYRIKVATDNLLMPTMKRVRSTSEPVSFLTKLLCSDPELYDELTQNEEFIVGGYLYKDLLKEIESTTDMNNNLLLYVLGQISMQRMTRVMEENNRVWNHWILPTGGNIEDPDASIALYNYKSTFMKVETVGINGNVSFTVSVAKSNFLHDDGINIMLKSMCKDYATQLRRAIILAPFPGSYRRRPLYINAYGRLATSGDKVKNCIANINIGKITTLKALYCEANQSVSQLMSIESDLFCHEFLYKFRHYVDDDYYINNLIENIELDSISICQHLISKGFIQNHFEYYKEISPYMGSGHFLELFNTSKNISCYTSRIDPLRLRKLVHIANFLKNDHKDDIIIKLCDCLKPLCSSSGISITEVLDPEPFIKGLMNYKFDQAYYKDFYDRYNKIESPPYEAIIQFVSSSTSVNGTLSKIILAIITILKSYPSRYIRQTDDLEI